MPKQPAASPARRSRRRSLAALVEAGYAVEAAGRVGRVLHRPGRRRPAAARAATCWGSSATAPSYHSARSARDRDRLRQQVLEGLGWRIHRIWSTDWFRNPDRELKRVVAAIDEAAARGDTSQIPVPTTQETTIDRAAADDDDATHSATGIPEYVFAEPAVQTNGLELHAVPVERLADWMADVVAVESPVHVDDAIRRVTDAAGVGRTGNRIRAALDAAIVRASLDGRMEQRGSFLWSAGMIEPPLRDRSSVNGRTLQNVAPEEIAVAIRASISNAYGIEQSQVASAACRLIGFPRLTEEMRSIVDPLVEAMLASGELERQGNHLTVA